MTTRGGPRVAYVVYWGATEPLGRNVAVPAVETLSRRVDVTLISFEKPEDRASAGRMDAVAARLTDAGAEWHPLTYRRSPPVISSFLDLRDGVRLVKELHGERPFDLILGRTYVGGLVGALSVSVAGLGIPFVYYHDACWPEEQVDVGKWSRGSLPDLAAHRLEAVSFRTADGVVALTRRTVERLRRDGRLPPGRPAVVAPTISGVVDVATPDTLRRPSSPGDPLRLLYLGNVAGRYDLDAILDFTAALRRRVPGSTLSVYAHRDRELVARGAERRGLADAVRTDRVEPARLPEVIPRHDAGLIFLEPGLSSGCTTPTKVGEYLAFGLPVVCNEAVGDVPRLLAEHDVGVVVRALEAGAYGEAAEELVSLVEDPDLPLRAHRTAAAAFDREAAARRQVELFRRVLGRDPAPAGGSP